MTKLPSKPRPLRVARATLADVDRIAPLFDAYRQFYKQRPDPAGARRFLRQRLKRGESVIFLALAGKQPVGFVQLYPSFESVTMRPLWILYDLFVAPEARRRGVARLLMDRARQLAVQTGATRLILETATDNRPGQRLYESLGWKRDTAFHRYSLDV